MGVSREKARRRVGASQAVAPPSVTSWLRCVMAKSCSPPTFSRLTPPNSSRSATSFNITLTFINGKYLEVCEKVRTFALSKKDKTIHFHGTLRKDVNLEKMPSLPRLCVKQGQITNFQPYGITVSRLL